MSSGLRRIVMMVTAVMVVALGACSAEVPEGSGLDGVAIEVHRDPG